jgi:hypothetical protein
MSGEDRLDHPSLRRRRSSFSQSEIIHSPIGFAWASSGSLGHPSQSPRYPPDSEPPSGNSKTKRSMDKGKERDKSRPKDKHQLRHKERHTYPPPNMDFQAAQRTNRSPSSFGMMNYPNEPTPAESHHMPIRSHHSPSYPPGLTQSGKLGVP